MSEYLAEFWVDFTKTENIIGHIAYVLLITSMMMRSINWLRALAILAGAVAAYYYWTLNDKVSMFWEIVFTLVNMAQFIILQIENRRGTFSEDEDYFIKTCLPDIELAHARRLVRLGAWTEVQEDAVLIVENTMPEKLKFVVSGKANVTYAKRRIGEVHRGDFLGEMSYLSGKPASATAIASERLRYLAFHRESLKRHLSKNPEVRHALEASFNRNLAHKLVKSNTGDIENSSSKPV